MRSELGMGLSHMATSNYQLPQLIIGLALVNIPGCLFGQVRFHRSGQKSRAGATGMAGDINHNCAHTQGPIIISTLFYAKFHPLTVCTKVLAGHVLAADGYKT